MSIKNNLKFLWSLRTGAVRIRGKERRRWP